MGLDLIEKLSRIAGKGESALLIDTPEEWAAANSFLEPKHADPEAEEIKMSEALEALQSVGAHGKFQVNRFFQECPIKRECSSLLIPLPQNAAVGFYVFSGIMVGEARVRWLTLLEEEWNQMTAPLSVTVPDPASEREKLTEVVEAFERKVSPPEDVEGYFGNYVRGAGQQSCIHKRLGIFQLLSALEMTGLLKHHHLDGASPQAGTEFIHVATRLRENKMGDAYVIDTWRQKNKADVWTQGYWLAYYAGMVMKLSPKRRW